MPWLLLLLAIGCRDQPAPDSPGLPPAAQTTDSAAVDSVVRETPSTYDVDLGALLLLPVSEDGTGTLAAVLSPLQPVESALDDTIGLASRVGDGVVSLYGREGVVGTRVLSQIEMLGSGECASWPIGRLSPRIQDSSAATPRVWRLALPAGRANAVPLDSIEALPARDSAMLAATLTRLASGVAEDSASAFRGLPFRVTRAYRAPGVAEPFVLAEMVRRVPQEDRPLEERLFMIVRTPGDDAKQWRISWFERVSGREEEVIATEPLAVVEIGAARRVLVFLGRDDGSGSALALLERSGEGWRVRWESPITGC